MPFTLAHPAAILPFHRKWNLQLQLLPLVAGSVAPDIPYFLPRWMVHSLPSGHTLSGSLTVSAPIGLALLLLLVLFRRALTALLWGPHHVLVSRGFASFSDQSARWLWAVPAVVLGVWTHTAWDSCTHSYGWTVLHLPALATQIPLGGVRTIELFRVLQHLSSIVGLLVLAWWYRRRMVEITDAECQAVQPAWRPTVIAAIFFLSCVTGLIAALASASPNMPFSRQVFFFVTSAGAAFASFLLVAGCAAAAWQRMMR
jgi:hypothetical protein